MCFSSSINPTIPIVGVGSTTPAGLSLYKRNISAGDRRAESAAGLGEAFDRFAQLPEIFRLVGIAEIQVIGHGQRRCAGAGEIARRFRDGDAWPPSRGSSAQ